MVAMNTVNLDRKLSALETRYEELNQLMAQPEAAQDPALLQRYGREYSSLNEVVQQYRALKSTRDEIVGTEQMLREGLDDEMRALAYEEIEQLRAREDELMRAVQVALLPKDSMDDRNAIVTVQAG